MMAYLLISDFMGCQVNWSECGAKVPNIQSAAQLSNYLKTLTSCCVYTRANACVPIKTLFQEVLYCLIKTHQCENTQTCTDSNLLLQMENSTADWLSLAAMVMN